jgi:hypothetical protein
MVLLLESPASDANTHGWSRKAFSLLTGNDVQR